MATDYYTASGSPATSSSGSSSVIRSEFTSIEAGFALLPDLTTVANRVVHVNSGSSALITTSGFTFDGTLLTAPNGLTVTTGTVTLASTIVTSGTTANIFNTTATTANIAGAATTLALGAATGTATINNATVTLANATTVNVNGASPTLASTSTGTLTLFNTNLVTVNAFGAATAIQIGASTGQTSVGGANVNNIRNQFIGSFTSGGVGTTAVGFYNGGTITGATGDTGVQAGAWFQANITTQNNSEGITTLAQAYFNPGTMTKGTDTVTTAATVYITGAPSVTGATQAALYVASGATYLLGDVIGAASQNVFNSVSTTVNAFGAATTLNIGAATGTVSVANPNFTLGGSQAINEVLSISAAAGYQRQINFQSSGSSRWILMANGTAESGSDAGSDFNLNARTDAGAAIDTVISIARVSGGSITITRPLVGAATQAVFNTTSTTVNAFGAATTLNIGGATGTLTVANPIFKLSATGSATILGPNSTGAPLDISGGSSVNAGGNLRLYGESHSTQANDVHLRSGTNQLLVWDDSATTGYIFNSVGTTVNAFGAATALNMVASGGRVGIGIASNNCFQFYLGGTFTAASSSTSGTSILLDTNIAGSAVQTVNLAQQWIAGTITLGSATTVGVVSALRVDEPDITLNTGTATIAATIYVSGAPTEGGTNAALYVASGDSYFGGNVMGLSSQALTLQSQSGRAIIFNTNGATQAARITSTGELIVSSYTSSPTGGNWNIEASGTANDGIALSHFATTSSTISQDLVFYRSNNASVGSHTVVVQDDQLGRIIARGSNGASYMASSYIAFHVDGVVTASASDMPGRISFWTSPDGSATPAERVRIDSSGNVGIGTAAAPSSMLHLSGAAPTITLTDTSGTSVSSTIDANSTAGVLLFSADTGNAGASSLMSWSIDGTEIMRLNSSAQLLVGTTTARTVGSVIPGIQNERLSQALSSMSLTVHDTVATGSPFFYFNRSKGSSLGSFTAVTTGDRLGGLVWSAADGTTYNSQAVAIIGYVDAAVSTNVVPGRLDILTANGSGTLVSRLFFNSAGGIFMGDTANANMTVGLTINQGANDNTILSLKSSDVSTNSGSWTPSGGIAVEPDDFLSISKQSATDGGMVMQVMQDDGTQNVVFGILAIGGQAATSDTTTSDGLVRIRAAEHDGVGGLVTNVANSNLMTWQSWTGAAWNTRMLLKADDGELHLGNTTLVALDDEDDALLVRAFQKESSVSGIIQSQWDNPFYDYHKLRSAGLVGEKDERGEFLFPLQPRLAVHEGAIWQNYTKLKDMERRISDLAAQNMALEAKLHLLENRHA